MKKSEESIEKRRENTLKNIQKEYKKQQKVEDLQVSTLIIHPNPFISHSFYP
jgi:hypothetical protein